MNRTATLLAALAVAFSATAATVRTATETFVTNRIAAAVAAIPAPDYSTNNAALVETIEATAPAPGDYLNVSNRAMCASNYTDKAVAGKRDYGDTSLNLPLTVCDYWYDVDALTNAIVAVATTKDSKGKHSPVKAEFIADFLSYGIVWRENNEFQRYVLKFERDDMTGGANFTAVNVGDQRTLGTMAFENGAAMPSALDFGDVVFHLYAKWDAIAAKSDIPPLASWAKAANKPTYTASEVGATTPEDVTAAIREQSLGGIWDEELQVWWTPRMRNGSLTYEATTNVNMEANQ